MPKTPEQLGRSLHDVLGHFLAFELPGLKGEIGLSEMSEDQLVRAEWELMAFVTFALTQAAASVIEDPARRQAVVAGFFGSAAGPDHMREFLAGLQPRFDEYERALPAGDPEVLASKAGVLLHRHLWPGDTPVKIRSDRLGSLYPRMYRACQKVVEG